ncbi:hypothetical protein ACUN7V_00055 [Quadrisphaera oryzae]|uniref:hypothetical protein n=1 Tax=Quadrisphaera TaxID=317661 RepID=UPI001645BA8D|nr:hypothetical protein [Quadrisphaera sp. RL12-1S]MBC3762968.1 hypothetical protein [Quadrisphaera sp. RL12-1S]
MPFLLATSFRRWLLLSVAVPVGAAVARKAARSIEARRGPSVVTKGLTKAADAAQRSKKGRKGRRDRTGR